MSVIILVRGDGIPQLHYSGTLPNNAFDEAYELLKQGVPGHFQMIPAATGVLEEAEEVLNK